MEQEKIKKIAFFAVGGLVLILVLVVLGILPGLKGDDGGGAPTIEATLNFWGIEDESYFRAGIESFTSENPSIRVSYKRIDEKNYESEVIDAIASGRGPDILMINNSWVRKHWEKLYPLSFGFTTRDIRDIYVDVVADDFIFNNQIWAVPLWVDTLALYYNKDFFNSEGLASPPKTWEEFSEFSKRLTIKTPVGQITRAGASFGTADNIGNSSDVLSALMMQSGLKIMSEGGSSDIGSEGGRSSLNFYTSFANPVSSNYSWNENMPDSLEAFSQGKTAMIIDYSKNKEVIDDLNQYLNYGIAPLPQISSERGSISVNYSDYWGLSVSPVSEERALASWDFILNFMGDEQIKGYLEKSNHPPAERNIIEQVKNDEVIGIFALQSLTARTWPNPDSEKTRKIFKDMIKSVVSGRFGVSQATNQANTEMNSLVR